jgi:hypothetical protein
MRKIERNIAPHARARRISGEIEHPPFPPVFHATLLKVESLRGDYLRALSPSPADDDKPPSRADPGFAQRWLERGEAPAVSSGGPYDISNQNRCVFRSGAGDSISSAPEE